jgi:hypothetical protein
LIGKHEGTNPLGITGRGRDDNIKIDLKEIGFEDVDFIHLVQDQEKWRKGRSATEMQAFFRRHCFPCLSGTPYTMSPRDAENPTSKHTKPWKAHVLDTANRMTVPPRRIFHNLTQGTQVLL